MTAPTSHSDSTNSCPSAPPAAGGERDSLETRRSLLTRLKDLDDQGGWREFFDRYWRLIYNVARKSGMSDADAQEIVQETMASLAGLKGGLQHDPARGKFRFLLLTIVRRRVVDLWRRRERQAGREAAGGEDAPDAAAVPGASEFDGIWDAEWRQSLLETAMSRVQADVSARQLQIFDLSVVQGVPATEIKARLGVSMTQIYMARFRVGRRVRAELQTLTREA